MKDKRERKLTDLINDLKQIILTTPEKKDVFISNPSQFIKNNDIDLIIKNNDNGNILFSDYISGLSLNAQKVIVGSIIETIDKEDADTDDDDDDDGWIDEVGGGSAAVVAVAVAISVALANVCAIANAHALANALANANGAGGGLSSKSYREVRLSEGALSSELRQILNKRGLNLYRQNALIKYLATTKVGGRNTGDELEKTTNIDYKDLNIRLTLLSKNGSYYITHATNI
ncbi:hypothetical protein AX333_25625 [Salmonella enterica]|nr:hypothetical protein [Salmonella enterica]EBB7877751.1 hypothetical protein [Salmonella enterica]